MPQLFNYPAKYFNCFCLLTTKYKLSVQIIKQFSIMLNQVPIEVIFAIRSSCSPVQLLQNNFECVVCGKNSITRYIYRGFFFNTLQSECSVCFQSKMCFTKKTLLMLVIFIVTPTHNFTGYQKKSKKQTESAALQPEFVHARMKFSVFSANNVVVALPVIPVAGSAPVVEHFPLQHVHTVVVVVVFGERVSYHRWFPTNCLMCLNLVYLNL